MKSLFIWALFLFIINTNCNIWDNIFGNFKSPNLIFPKNWQTVITSKNDLMTFNVSLSYSSNIGFFKVVTVVDLFNANEYMNASEIVLDLKQDLLYFHSPAADCEIYQTPQLLKGTFNNSDMTNIWKMIAFYNGETKTGLKKFDITGLFSLLNSDPSIKIYTYFNKKSQLNYLEITSNGKNLLFDVIEKLKETQFSKDFFDVPEEWNCTNKTAQNLTDINTFGLESVLKDLLVFNLNNLAESESEKYKDKSDNKFLMNDDNEN